MTDKNQRLNLSFERTREGILAYEFLKRCPKRKKSRFIAQLICDYLRQGGIKSLKELEEASESDIDYLIAGNGRTQEGALMQVIEKLVDKIPGIMQTSTAINAGSTVDLQKTHVETTEAPGSTVDLQEAKLKPQLQPTEIVEKTEEDLPSALDVSAEIEDIEELDDIDIPDDYADSLNMFK